MPTTSEVPKPPKTNHEESGDTTKPKFIYTVIRKKYTDWSRLDSTDYETVLCVVKGEMVNASFQTRQNQSQEKPGQGARGELGHMESIAKEIDGLPRT